VLASELCGIGFVRTGEAIARATHRPTLPPQLQNAAARICAVLAAKKVDPPSRAELAPEATSQQARRFLRDCGELVELSTDVVLVTEQFVKMREAVVAFLRKNNSAGASELRELLGTSRRVTIPFLERLDRDGVTRRIGDKRALAKPHLKSVLRSEDCFWIRAGNFAYPYPAEAADQRAGQKRNRCERNDAEQPE